MKLAVMQPYLFPYIGYFQLIAAVDKFVLLDDVTFIKKGWINRNRILINGEPSLFTVPLKKSSQNKLIKDIQITSVTKWRYKLLKTIEYNYKKAPFFDNVFSMLKGLLNSNVQTISELNFLSIQQVCSCLKIPTVLIPNTAGYENSHLNGHQRILDICKQEDADSYINPVGGMELYESSHFENEQIELSFLKPIAEPYSQFNRPFVPFLSILDVMMFCGPGVIKKQLLSKFELI